MIKVSKIVRVMIGFIENTFLINVFAKLKTTINFHRFKKKNVRFLEIGPGQVRIDGFETLNIKYSKNVDFVLDASKKMPFTDNTFDVIYASHILEHISWYRTKDVLSEWIRILKPGGELELWVPDSVKIAKAFVDAELLESKDFLDDGWFKFNTIKDSCVWFSGRVFSYGDGKSDYSNVNWHHAAFSYRYLSKLLLELNLRDVTQLPSYRNRGTDFHGWINLGILGRK
jgi:predicted SAM-dependent methyltransferase